MGKTSRRANRAYRRRDWFGRDNVAHFVAWYSGPDLRAQAIGACRGFAADKFPDLDETQLQALTWTGGEAREFIRYVRREAATLALVRHYNEIETLLRGQGGWVLAVTYPADPPGVPAVAGE